MNTSAGQQTNRHESPTRGRLRQAHPVLTRWRPAAGGLATTCAMEPHGPRAAGRLWPVGNRARAGTRWQRCGSAAHHSRGRVSRVGRCPHRAPRAARRHRTQRRRPLATPGHPRGSTRTCLPARRPRRLVAPVGVTTAPTRPRRPAAHLSSAHPAGPGRRQGPDRVAHFRLPLDDPCFAVRPARAASSLSAIWNPAGRPPRPQRGIPLYRAPRDESFVRAARLALPSREVSTVPTRSGSQRSSSVATRAAWRAVISTRSLTTRATFVSPTPYVQPAARASALAFCRGRHGLPRTCRA